MTKVKVKALQSFSHGSVDAHAGQTVAINKGDADELARLGFVQAADTEPEQEPVHTDPDAEEKADTPLANKMDEVPKNKVAAHKSKAK